MKVIEAIKPQLPIIAELAYAIWPIAYGKILSKEQLTYMLDKFYSLEALIDQLEKRNHVFLLIEENEQFVGFASYQLNIENNKTKIHKIYVLPETQGRGLGKQLIHEIENAAKKAESKILYLNVNRFNEAQNFYHKLGFQITDKEDINIGDGYLMEDFVMKKPI